MVVLDWTHNFGTSFRNRSHTIAPIGIVAILILVFTALNYFGNEIALTNKRVIGKTGVLRRNSIDLKIDKIDSVVLDQGIVARMLGSGNIVVSSANSKSGFPFIDNPTGFRSAVNERLYAETTTTA